jgi:hypothetical protein
VLVAWFGAGGRAVNCTGRGNCVEGIEKDKMCGAGTECGRKIQSCGGETGRRILEGPRSKCGIILKWKK